MTFKEKIALDKERATSAEALRKAQQVARTAIGQIEQDADLWKIYAEADWMHNIDPAATGPKMVCSINSTHNTKLAAELTARLAE